jgi:hypothetical protein
MDHTCVGLCIRVYFPGIYAVIYVYDIRSEISPSRDTRLYIRVYEYADSQPYTCGPAAEASCRCATPRKEFLEF